MAREKPQGDTSGRYRLAGAGFEIAAAVAGFTLIGWYIDQRFGTSYGALIGAILGIIGGLYNFIKQSLKIVQDEQQRHHQRDDDGDRSG